MVRITKVVILVVVLALGLSPSALPTTFKQHQRIANEMARRGLWGEAKYRWELMNQLRPNDPATLNNLAVAAEAKGDVSAAAYYYAQAFSLGGAHEAIAANWRHFMHAHPELGALVVDDLGEPVKVRGRSTEVPVPVLIQPRVDIAGKETVLVTAFRADETSMMRSLHGETEQYMRRELYKHSGLHVLDVVPAPPIPEQMLERLLKNAEFWRFLADQYGADLILGGVIKFTRVDASSYEEIEHKDQQTGKMHKQVRMIQKEEFYIEVIFFFIDGPTGELLDVNRYRGKTLFRGEMNDPLTAFYGMCHPASIEMLLAIIPHRRMEMRHVFRSW